jgi:hypothetical protein
MAISQQVVPSKLRHLQSFAGSSIFYPPLGTTIVYVAVIGGSGGNMIGHRYATSYNGGTSVSAGGYVQVSPGNPHAVTIGSGGFNVTAVLYNAFTNNAGSSGVTSFDGAITANSAIGGTASTNGTAGTISATTSLPALNPGGSTIVRVTGFSNGANVASGGASGVVHIYGY